MTKHLKQIILTTAVMFFFTSVFSQTVIKMEKKNGVYYVPCTVNGLKLQFIFDTGAGDVSISLSEAVFMIKNGYMSENDLIGTEYYRIANGEVAEGTKIIIKELKIGDKTLYNVKASIVHTLSAPLLLGQSAIERFGKFSVDYSTNTLVLGGTSMPSNVSSNNSQPTKTQPTTTTNSQPSTTKVKSNTSHTKKTNNSSYIKFKTSYKNGFAILYNNDIIGYVKDNKSLIIDNNIRSNSIYYFSIIPLNKKGKVKKFSSISYPVRVSNYTIVNCEKRSISFSYF